MQNSLSEFIDEPTIDIVWPELADVAMKGKKPKDSWMKDHDLDTRLEAFFNFCRVFDERDDRLLRDDYQIFSHRLHWHEHPYCYEMAEVTDPVDRLFYTLVFSFSNEHWGTFKLLKDHGIDATRQHFVNNRHARNDLFQIYYPKGTNVKEWLLDGPLRAARELHDIFEGREKPYTMMGFAKKLEAYFKKAQGFRSPLYPCKNTARYIAMSYPHLVDPETVLFGGTGHFDGLHQIFGGDNLNGKVKYDVDEDGEFKPLNKQAELWLHQMKILCEDPRNPMTAQKMLNVEDKTCFAWKHLAIGRGEKRPTKRIPYNWIFPDSFDLSKRSDNTKVYPR